VYFIGVDLGGTNMASALMDEKGNVYHTNVIATEAYKGPKHVIDNMKNEIRKLIEKTPTSRVDGIGLGIPGLIDIERGYSRFAGNLGWQNVPVLDEFKKEFDVPICMDNDVRVAALGEKYFGAGVGVKNQILVTLGTGVGSGIIIDGKLHRGYSASAGEIGHVCIEKDGYFCNCGNRGCLEMYVSAPGIVRRTKRYIMEGHFTIITSMVNDELSKITPKIVSEAADKGDGLARLIIDETAKLLGIGLATYAHIINPELIIVGGGVSLMGDKLFVPLRKYFDEHLMMSLRGKVSIVPSKLKDQSGMIGAAALSMLELGVL